MGCGSNTWSPHGSDNAFDMQVGKERLPEMVLRSFGDVLMEKNDQWSLNEGCPGCWYLKTGQGRQQANSEACRRRIEALLKSDSSGSARLAAADEIINRTLAEAVERHATRNERHTEVDLCRLPSRFGASEANCAGTKRKNVNLQNLCLQEASQS